MVSKPLAICPLLCAVSAAVGAPAPIDVGSRLELLVDDALIDRMAGGMALRLHEPSPREVAIVHDAPWEGNSCGYHTVFQDGPLYRMYYRGGSQTLKGEPPAPPMTVCCALSTDGVHWTKPDLGLVEFAGSHQNNILMMGEMGHNFVPFKDTNPDCKPAARYKALALEGNGLRAFQSPDGLRWSRMQEGPVLTQGAFDSQNLAFWDGHRGEYRAYFRDFREGRRDIKTATSKDFLHWTEPQWLSYPGAPPEQLYTNQVLPYYRAPHLLLGFPTRYVEREWTPATEKLPGLEHRRKRSEVSMREGTAVTDGLFMSSRDGVTFRRWDGVFRRPGLRTGDNWVYGDNYQSWGIVETAPAMEHTPKELSIYATEAYWMPKGSRLRRFTLRVDGFASAHAPRSGGELITKPLLFDGDRLVLNFSTSAAGSVRIEVQDEAGKPLPGFTLAEAPELYGDSLEYVAHWAGGRDLEALSGKPVRLRFVMADADLYSFRFTR